MALLMLVCIKKLSTIYSINNNIWSFIIITIFISPSVLKHSSSIDYEEGILIDLLVIYSLSFYIFLYSVVKSKRINQVLTSIIIMMLSITLCYLTKASIIFLYAGSLLLCSAYLIYDRRIFIALCLCTSCLLPLLFWGGHNLKSGNVISVMTSWDGENLFKGNSSQGLALYPNYSLDRIFDPNSTRNIFNGEMITGDFLRRKDFNNEWESNDYYKNKSYSWIVHNPGDFFRFTGLKIYNFFFSIQKSPRTYSYQLGDYNAFSFENIAIMVWLILGRIATLLSLVLGYLSYRKNSRLGTVYFIAFIFIGILYSTPYIIGFNYERHITPFICITLISLGFIYAEYKKLP